MTHEFNVAAQNEQARVAQAYAGVNPGECLTLVEIPGGDRTPLELYLQGLSQRQYCMPAESHPRIGNRPSWREHDISYHARRVGALHPAIVEVITTSASEGCIQLSNGQRGPAKRIAESTDVTLSSARKLWDGGLYNLWCRIGRNPEAFETLIEVQAQHFARLVEHSPNLFQSIRNGQRRV